METLTCGTGTDGHHHKLVQTSKVDTSDLSVIDRLSDDVDSAVVSNILTLQGYAKWGGCANMEDGSLSDSIFSSHFFL